MNASTLKQVAQQDNNQRLVLNTFTNNLYWFPTSGVVSGQLPSEVKLEGPTFFLRPATDNERFGGARKDVIEIGGIACEVVVLHNHQLPYESQVTAEDFNRVIDTAVHTGALEA